MKLCKCGCGRKVKENRIFIKGHSSRTMKINNLEQEYNRTRNKEGYVVLEHRHIWEKHFGKIPEDYFIHHKNGNKRDNRIENLELVIRKEHGKVHRDQNGHNEHNEHIHR